MLEDMLRARALDFEDEWDKHLPLVEFSCNKSYQATIGMPPYEALYRRKYRSPLHWDEVGKKVLVRPELVDQAYEKIQVIR